VHRHHARQLSAPPWNITLVFPDAQKRLNKSIAAIYQEAKHGKLPKTPPLARVMNSGGMIMLLAGIVSGFV
jgi:hypothetical protein